jgi:hypothetical protein
MMKQAYQQPTMNVVKLQHHSIICVSNPVSRVGGNAELNYEGGGSGSARARRHGVWDDDWDEE